MKIITKRGERDGIGKAGKTIEVGEARMAYLVSEGYVADAPDPDAVPPKAVPPVEPKDSAVHVPEADGAMFQRGAKATGKGH